MSHPKRILILLGSLGGGGSERQVVELLRHLDRRRFQPRLYLIYRQGEWLSAVPDDVEIHAFAECPAVPRWNYPGRLLREQARDITRVLREQSIDVLYDRTSQMALTAWLARRPLHTARVAVLAGDPRQEFATAHRRFAFVKRWMLRQAYRDADRVLAVSEGVRQGAIDFYGIAPPRILTMPNLFDAERIQRDAAEHSVERNAETFHLVTVGRLQREKGHAVLLAALHDLVYRRGRRQLHLWLLGDGPERSVLEDQVARQGLAGYVEFLGFRANPLPWVRAADLFCMPSLYEGMPNALVEALLCETPVVVSDCPSGPREILDGGRFGKLVPTADPRALADAIDDAISHYPAWRQRSVAARNHAVTTFALDQGIERLQSLFEQLHASKASVRGAL